MSFGDSLSQEAVYGIIKELGGEATSEQIRKRAEKNFPDATLHLYISNRLRRLSDKGAIKLVDAKERRWRIISKFR